MLASLGLALLALVTFSLLWPVTFVAVVLLLAVVCPIVSVGAGVRAILEHGRRRHDAKRAAGLAPADKTVRLDHASSTRFRGLMSREDVLAKTA
jgi:hypothetical protein